MKQKHIVTSQILSLFQIRMKRNNKNINGTYSLKWIKIYNDVEKNIPALRRKASHLLDTIKFNIT